MNRHFPSRRSSRTAWPAAAGYRLEIRPARDYGTPGYPRGTFVLPPRTWSELAMRRLLPPALLLSVLESCVGSTGGVPPNNPRLVTEAEARMLIDTAFVQRGIRMTPDVTIGVAGARDSVLLDGHNDSLKVGYEYVSSSDTSSFSPAVRTALTADSSRHVKIIDEILDETGYEVKLKVQVDSFIDSLKIAGMI